MTHLDFPACHESPIGDALRVIRLRTFVSRWVGDRWVHVSVKRRAEHNAFDLARVNRRPDHPKRWQPPEGRESPREAFMDMDRRSRIRYEYAGAMRYLHGKAPPLIGRSLLYDPFAPREAYRHPLYDREAKDGTTGRT